MEEKTLRVRGRIKIKKRSITLDQVASQLAQDVVSAIYASIGNRTVADLDAGDELSEVVDQSLDRHGMAEQLMRLSSTRIEVCLGLDVSGSQYGGRGNNKTIIPSIAMVRLFAKAFKIVEGDLPPNVFKWNLWLWASESYGVTEPDYSTAFQWHNRDAIKIDVDRLSGEGGVDSLLKSMLTSRGWWCGGGTSLRSFMSSLLDWERDKGDPIAHRLTIAVTDGLIGDVEECSKLNVLRSGRVENMLLNIAHNVGAVPEGFTGYYVSAFDVEAQVRQALMDFVQRLY